MASILIVDDEPDSAEFVAKYLRRQGYDTAVARNGEDALRLLLQSQPDAVIIDVRMPHMDGITLLRIMRSHARWSSTPVIILSAMASDQERDDARSLGALSVYDKAAFRLEDLMNWLNCLKAFAPPREETGTA